MWPTYFRKPPSTSDRLISSWYCYPCFGALDIHQLTVRPQSNAGIEHFGDLDKVTGEDIDKVFAVNVKGQFFVAQHAGKHMAPNGRLILMSSISSVLVRPSPFRPTPPPTNY